MKVDRFSIYVGTYGGEGQDQDVFLKAFDILFQLYHTFGLEYHVYLGTLFNFLESTYGLTKTKNPTVKLVEAAIRAYQKKHP